MGHRLLWCGVTMVDSDLGIEFFTPLEKPWPDLQGCQCAGDQAASHSPTPVLHSLQRGTWA